jgi:ubiquinone/menaquinone biosynthesis C-methylase UbiE
MSESIVDIRKWQMTHERAERMARLSKTGFQSYIHPRLARQLLNDFGITHGECLDIGTGAARLSIELARITHLHITALDVSPAMTEIARREVAFEGLADRITVLEGTVEAMPFEDNRFDLIVSRGSAGFWSDKVQAFREIYRVLKPGGHTFIGGGDARGIPDNVSDIFKMIRFRIFASYKRLQQEWRRLWLPRKDWEEILRLAGINSYRIHACRLWIDIEKPTNPKA